MNREFKENLIKIFNVCIKGVTRVVIRIIIIITTIKWVNKRYYT